ncbi:hypothetical protein [Marinoscillum pacificum]|uniref:hypothetical protein n=1 Tax=Marinoscillum pacificum TaxID=392723 RepID=UPI0021588F1E|nr:hypothetical protein [Marinoscillum pacificum]
MKVLLLTLTILPTILLGQELTEVRTNLSTEESQNSIIWTEFSDEYDQVLAFSRNSYWSQQKVYIIYGRTNGQWERIKLTLKLDGNKNIIRTKSRKLSFGEGKFQELLTFFDSRDFWNFELDSLNLHEEVREDGSGTLWTKTDGTTDSFEVISNGHHRIISSYEPEYFQELIPVEQRRKFIECRNEFLRMNKMK